MDDDGAVGGAIDSTFAGSLRRISATVKDLNAVLLFVTVSITLTPVALIAVTVAKTSFLKLNNPSPP